MFYFREGFYCNKNLAGGGKDITCQEGERINVNMVNLTWSCIEVRKSDWIFLNISQHEVNTLHFRMMASAQEVSM
jgi:hypothetical protein